ncbi:kelch-like protein [Archangium violaceum]|uniref:Kelch repeat-containing protein n=1 Tax=Archangium violaceum TaxID=83451 RepID=UPI002B27F1C7|nr:kelch-like protein [Archangium violaceum]
MYQRGTRLLPWLVAAWMVIVSGCRPDQPTEQVGAARVVGRLEQASSASDVRRVTVALTAPDLNSPRPLELTLVDGEWSGTLSGIPAGEGRTFTAEGFGSDGSKTYEGQVSGVTILSGQTVEVILSLRRLNTAPRVASVTATPSTVKVGETSTLAVTASDEDGDALAYQWSASGCSGTWGDATSATARFTPEALPPGGSCDCHLSVAVSDEHGGLAHGTQRLCVETEKYAPEVVSSSQSSSFVPQSGTVTLRVEARDPQDSALSFTWEASQGTPGPPTNTATTSEVVWTVPECVSGEKPVTLTATVSNTWGLSTSRSFTIRGAPGCLPSNSWSAMGGLSWGRQHHTATLLPSGRVLVIGGEFIPPHVRTTEVYDPATKLSLLGGRLVETRKYHTATMLPSGKVLIAGGETASAELYDPETRTSAPTGSMADFRSAHTATLLPSGKVLVVGGRGSLNESLLTAELYDPATGTWSPAGFLAEPHSAHTATRLSSGQVLVAGGTTTAVELYDPQTGAWTSTSSLDVARSAHSAVLLPSGKVLVMGGEVGGKALETAQLYDPTTGTWSATGSLADRRWHMMATVLESGRVLIVGGEGTLTGSWNAELYDPETGTWTSAGRLKGPRYDGGTMTLLPSGTVLVLGGRSDLLNAEMYDPATGTWSATSTPDTSTRYARVATRLPSGKVLLTGGVYSTQLYDPATRSFSSAGEMDARGNHTATPLPSGKVLVVGGTLDFSQPGPRLYEPETGTWLRLAPLATPRKGGHTATLLHSGKVLVAGGETDTAELYDPATNTWTPAGKMSASRYKHTATLLPSGKVLVLGGGWSYSTELYDPATNTWTPAAPLKEYLSGHSAILLPSGKVLVGGSKTIDLYDPAMDTWTTVFEFSESNYRFGHVATLLPSGKVLMIGGTNTLADSVAMYDPETGTWTPAEDAGILHTSIMGHSATVLPSGQVLLMNGIGSAVAPAMLYNP